MSISFRYSITLPDGSTHHFTSDKPNLKYAVVGQRTREPDGSFGGFYTSSPLPKNEEYVVCSVYATKSTANKEVRKETDEIWTLQQKNTYVPFSSFLVMIVDYHPRTKLLVPNVLAKSKGWGTDDWNLYDPDHSRVVDTAKWTVPMWASIRWQFPSERTDKVISHWENEKCDFVKDNWRPEECCQVCRLTYKERTGVK